ncbi:hypothetical protein BASA60_009574 [Batrachochytrium salamandrivorans]|nr:hypothetical protein BASA60_009574 [Batrachochytrium salamandrivorans]KAH9272466.1 hypothetical protein BASA83_005273 [Batrachochytrium salamandrivorans]
MLAVPKEQPLSSSQLQLQLQRPPSPPPSPPDVCTLNSLRISNELVLPMAGYTFDGASTTAAAQLMLSATPVLDAVSAAPKKVDQHSTTLYSSHISMDENTASSSSSASSSSGSSSDGDSDSDEDDVPLWVQMHGTSSTPPTSGHQHSSKGATNTTVSSLLGLMEGGVWGSSGGESSHGSAGSTVTSDTRSQPSLVQSHQHRHRRPVAAVAAATATTTAAGTARSGHKAAAGRAFIPPHMRPGHARRRPKSSHSSLMKQQPSSSSQQQHQHQQQRSRRRSESGHLARYNSDQLTSARRPSSPAAILARTPTSPLALSALEQERQQKELELEESTKTDGSAVEDTAAGMDDGHDQGKSQQPPKGHKESARVAVRRQASNLALMPNAISSQLRRFRSFGLQQNHHHDMNPSNNPAVAEQRDISLSSASPSPTPSTAKDTAAPAHPTYSTMPPSSSSIPSSLNPISTQLQRSATFSSDSRSPTALYEYQQHQQHQQQQQQQQQQQHQQHNTMTRAPSGTHTSEDWRKGGWAISRLFRSRSYSSLSAAIPVNAADTTAPSSTSAINKQQLHYPNGANTAAGSESTLNDLEGLDPHNLLHVMSAAESNPTTRSARVQDPSAVVASVAADTTMAMTDPSMANSSKQSHHRSIVMVSRYPDPAGVSLPAVTNISSFTADGQTPANAAKGAPDTTTDVRQGDPVPLVATLFPRTSSLLVKGDLGDRERSSHLIMLPPQRPRSAPSVALNAVSPAKDGRVALPGGSLQRPLLHSDHSNIQVSRLSRAASNASGVCCTTGNSNSSNSANRHTTLALDTAGFPSSSAAEPLGLIDRLRRIFSARRQLNPQDLHRSNMHPKPSIGRHFVPATSPTSVSQASPPRSPLNLRLPRLPSLQESISNQSDYLRDTLSFPAGEGTRGPLDRISPDQSASDYATDIIAAASELSYSRAIPDQSHRKLATTRALQQLYMDICFGSLELNELAQRYDGDLSHLDDETVLSTVLSIGKYGDYGDGVATSVGSHTFDASLTSTQQFVGRLGDLDSTRHYVHGIKL